MNKSRNLSIQKKKFNYSLYASMNMRSYTVLFFSCRREITLRSIPFMHKTRK